MGNSCLGSTLGSLFISEFRFSFDSGLSCFLKGLRFSFTSPRELVLEFGAGILGKSKSRSASGLGSGWSISGRFLDEIGDMAMECRWGGTANSCRAKESELLFLDVAGSGGIKFVHSEDVWTFFDWKASWLSDLAWEEGYLLPLEPS